MAGRVVTNWGFLLVAGLLAAVGVVLVFQARKSSRHADLVEAVRTRRIGDLERVKPGRLVEVQGRIRCDEPLYADFSRRPCVYHRSQVERETEDSDGDTEWRTVQDATWHTKFLVQDRTGTVWVDPEGAEFDAQRVLKNYDRVGGVGGVNLRFSLGSMDFSGRTRGMRYTEHLLAVDAPVYVLGVLGNNGVIRAPRDASGRASLLISYRGEEGFRGKLRKTAFWSMVGAPLCFLGAVAAMVAGVMGVR